ncbi:hypothetical protein PGAG_00368 [Phaeocystis globosa virus 12T]|uniref:Uncharacterized protein n=1 Tax=Phaeocystis globosa virus PgV-16T TaxID=3071227 RepID=A0AC59EXK8_9VIRU|nr:hypothetical protein PGCG_00413 [Phaeocystis globosa virus]AET73257.1 hypothetical protein PGAG_00368 [Phaeocystis globosa virus 12T]AET73676.1 hypothetical protein PGBG_00365 [Phaeocystis globosa virus 14T]AGM15717.1 hypothetical protein PGCG_00413 [Phaeocystis globosa virus PgV-16T]UYE94447.1 hypothetical protein PGV14T_00413 [Phaeocystis globosa virus]
MFRTSRMNKDMRLSSYLKRQLHHYDDYVMRSEIIPSVPVPMINETPAKSIYYIESPKSVNVCADCSGTGWKTINDMGSINTNLNLQFKFELCKTCRGTGFH